MKVLLRTVRRLWPAAGRWFVVGLTILASVGLDPSANARSTPLTCAEITGLIQAKTGVNLWKSYPNLSFAQNDQAFAVRLKLALSNEPQYLWRYLNDLCADCGFEHNDNPDIIISQFDDVRLIKGGARLYAPPEGVGHNYVASEYIVDRIRQGQQAFTSLNVVDRGSSPPVQITMISIYSKAIAERLDTPSFLVSLFEAYVDIKFWDNEALREDLKQEFLSGCIDGRITSSCEVLNFGRFLYRNMNNTKVRDPILNIAEEKLCDAYHNQRVE